MIKISLTIPVIFDKVEYKPGVHEVDQKVVKSDFFTHLVTEQKAAVLQAVEKIKKKTVAVTEAVTESVEAVVDAIEVSQVKDKSPL